MALSRNRRDSNIIWPGFVDAVTTLLMVLIFVVTIFTVMQSVLREEIETTSNEVSELTGQVAALSDALGLERRRTADLQGELGAVQSSLAVALAESQRQAGVISDFEMQVAALLSQRDADKAQITALEDAKAEEARLAAARAAALEALIADLEKESAGQKEKLSEAEAARLADAAALAALREKFANSESEMTALTLALEAARKEAEENLTLLAAAKLQSEEGAKASDALAIAEANLMAEKEKVLKAARETELLNQQLAALRAQLGSLQGILDKSEADRAAANLQIDSLGRDLNAALAQVASEQRKRAEMEEAERLRLEAENNDLQKFRSEFFGQLSQLLAGREGVRVVGDRFVFSSEVLFQTGAADLSPEGQSQIASVAKILNEVRQEIPESIDWIIRVDGHTDNIPLSGQGQFRDNWELSQARALSVVRYMQNALGFPPERLAATGFGEYRPVAAGDSEAARAQNRRIELKLTER